MNLDHDFFQASKLSEGPKKEGLYQKWNTFFPSSSEDLRSDADQCQIIGGDADVDHTQIIGWDTVKLLGGYIPYPPFPPGFSTSGRNGFIWFFPSLYLRLASNFREIIWILRFHREVGVVFGFTTDRTIFALHSASETDSFNKGTFSTWGLRFDVSSASGLKGAHGRVLSLLALSLKNSMILGCDRATSSEFRGYDPYYFSWPNIRHSHKVGFL